jgi:hypothetical protein
LFDLSSKVKVISVAKEYDASILQVFHATGDFNFRHHWQEGVKAVEEVDHFPATHWHALPPCDG